LTKLRSAKSSPCQAQAKPEYKRDNHPSEEEALGLEEAPANMTNFLRGTANLLEMKRASTSVLQRRLRIGYGRAAAILDIWNAKTDSAG